MRKAAIYLLVVLAHVAAFLALRSYAVLNEPALDNTGGVARVALGAGTLELEGAAGEPVEFRIEGLSLGGLWASPRGLMLTFEHAQPGLGGTMPVVAPKAKDWEKFVSGDDQGFSIPASFRIPSHPALVNQTIQGTISGTVELPEFIGAERTISGGESPAFRDKVVRVGKRIQVRVTAPEQSPRARATSRARVQLIASAAVFLALVGGAAYLGLRKPRAG